MTFEYHSLDSYSLVYDTNDAIRNLSQKLQEANIRDMGKVSSSGEKSGGTDAISQIQFIQLWKSFYDLLAIRNEEMHLFHALAVAGTLLLQLGETQKNYLHKVEKDIQEAIVESVEIPLYSDEELSVDTKAQKSMSSSKEETRPAGDLKSCINDGEWRLNLEQIIATVLAEPSLSEFFDYRVSLKEIVEQFRKRTSSYV